MQRNPNIICENIYPYNLQPLTFNDCKAPLVQAQDAIGTVVPPVLHVLIEEACIKFQSSALHR